MGDTSILCFRIKQPHEESQDGAWLWHFKQAKHQYDFSCDQGHLGLGQATTCLKKLTGAALLGSARDVGTWPQPWVQSASCEHTVPLKPAREIHQHRPLLLASDLPLWAFDMVNKSYSIISWHKSWWQPGGRQSWILEVLNGGASVVRPCAFGESSSSLISHHLPICSLHELMPHRLMLVCTCGDHLIDLECPCLVCPREGQLLL